MIAGVLGLEPRMRESESLVLPITPYPKIVALQALSDAPEPTDGTGQARAPRSHLTGPTRRDQFGAAGPLHDVVDDRPESSSAALHTDQPLEQSNIQRAEVGQLDEPICGSRN